MSDTISLAKEVDARHDYLIGVKEKYKDGWLRIAKYFNPLMLPLLENEESEAEDVSKEVYDGTAIGAAVTMTNGLIGLSISSSSPWMHIEIEDQYIMKDLKVREWCQAATIAMYSALSRSNFYDAMVAFTYQGITTGPGIMYVEEDVERKVLVFSNRHIAECSTALDFYSKNNIMDREFKETARNLVQRFGEKTMDDDVLRAYKSDKAVDAYKEFDVLHSVFPAGDSKWSKIGKKYISVYKIMGKDQIISEKGYDDFPYSVWNWELLSRETYPRTPAHIAIWDTQTLQAMNKTMLKAGEYMADNPLNVPEEMRGKVRNNPRGVNYYRDPSRVITRVPGPTQIPYADSMYTKKVRAVEDHFYVDFWKMLSQLTQRMTGLEVMERQNEKIALIGVPVSRYNSEALDSLLERAFKIEYMAGRIPPPPPGLGKEELRMVYTGPLSVLQKRLAQGQSISRAITEMTPIFQMFEGSTQPIKATELVNHMMDIYDFPVSSRKSATEIKKELAAAAEAQQQAMQAQQTDQAAKLLPGMAKAKEAGLDVA